MKVAIITMNGFVNIGNRLQNYAVQEILKDRGCEVSTLLYSEFDDTDASYAEKLKTIFRNLLVKSGVYTSDFYITKVKKNPKMKIVNEFNKQYLNISKKYFYKKYRMKKYARDFDYYCAGSDQVWNAALVKNCDFFFMTFAEPQKTFSFSASMGTTYIDKKYLDTYMKGFQHVGKISVREKNVEDLIKKMVDREVTVLLDPTLLLSKEKWLSISKKPAVKLPQKFVATYFLGEITESQRRRIENYANSKGFGIVDINGKYSDYVGPQEFIYLLKNADFIFTDSFHGTVFSLLFDKKFLVFQRNNIYDMSSRITNILNKCNLSHRFFYTDNNNIDDNIINLIERIENENLDFVPEFLNKEKEKAQVFLNDVFNR